MKALSPILFLFASFSTLCISCTKEEGHPGYREQMRAFVQEISERGRAVKPGFIVIPQNGLQLLTDDGTLSGMEQVQYLAAIDGVGQEELFYGYDNADDVPTPEAEHSELLGLTRFARAHGLAVLTTDYCSTTSKIDDSYTRNAAEGFISFAADHRELDNIPAYPGAPYNETRDTIATLAQAKNFLYLISPSAYAGKEEFLDAVAATRYDAVIMDLFYDENTQFTSADLDRIRMKPDGGPRLLICYMSIGQAESYRWYWKPSWNSSRPSFVITEDPYWTDNFYVNYWDPAWKGIICGSGDSYLDRVVDAGFDGVYLDLVSAFEFFEER